MITDSYPKMMSNVQLRSVLGSNDYSDDLGKELGLLLQRRQEANDLERELSLYRSGSAPPTVEGSLSAVGGLFGQGPGADVTHSDFSKNSKGLVSEEELRSDPAYINYYYSNVNLNPRLPPPLLSKEDWRFQQRLQGGSSALGGIGDRRKLNRSDEGGNSSRSMYSMQTGFNVLKEESKRDSRQSKAGAEWGGDGLIGLPGLGLGRQKSLAEIIQDDINQAPTVPRHPSRPVSRNAFDDNVDSSETRFAQLHPELPSSVETNMRTTSNFQSMSAMQNVSQSASHTYASALGASLSRSTTPDPQLVARAPSPRIPPVGINRVSSMDKRSGSNGPNSFMNESEDLVAALSGMNLSTNGIVDGDINHSRSKNHHEINDQHLKQHSYLSKGSSPSYYQNVDGTNSSFPNYNLSGYHAMNPASPSMMASQIGAGNLPPLFENVAAQSALGGGSLTSGPNLLAAAAELQNLNRAGSHTLQMPSVDPMYLQYLRSAEYTTALNDPSMDSNYMGNSYADLVSLQKAYLGALLTPHKSQYNPYLTKSGSLNQGYYGNFGLPFVGPLLPNSPVGPGNPLRHAEWNMRFPSGMRNLVDESFASSLLDEFKSNKTRCFELAEIAGHVVEFSADQYGSRFIQQKLETATLEEKNMVFQEIFPQALSLMTDVFGNYVIQKFFEHGTASQIRELADQLTGHVLTLSLQMYGCRVIQKAIEVVDLDQQTKMVAELDGHVMRCVRDQNGNHVIQKCIECIPQDSIQFIVSTFYDQVVTLSTHPYGCRVIQRVLEHCTDPKTQQIMMDEILQSVCMLAQDQYGNYVVQHVLEHGKPHERSAIITKLAGQIVQMSQQKFASNVVEKCLTFGGPAERQILVNEMLGTTDENEPLQAMMKDQFANYVVQKVLETCDDQQLELILSRIKVHLNALKKYTYGKHIVARVEKLVAAGERRIGILSPYSS